MLTGCLTLDENDDSPVIEGFEDITFIIGETTPDYLDGVIATDEQDGDVTTSIYFNDDDVDYELAGTYTVTYYVIDQDGHLVTEPITVTVAEPTMQEDTTLPIIYGATDREVTIGDPIPNYLSGLAASDNIDGDITDDITFNDSDVNYQSEGTYTVTYSVFDVAGNEQTATILVTVLPRATTSTIGLYYLNDFHGAILRQEDQLGLAYIANLIMTDQAENPNGSLFITGGDMLQGALLSNYYQGASVIDMLNTMHLDAFVLGNHEFDWGLDVVLQYFDQDSDASVHANFPLLGANVIEKSTGERPVGIDPYAVIQKQGYKIGVIGTIGYGLEDTIAVSKVSDYEFTEPVESVEYYATYLRQIEDVDLVIAVCHDASDYYNNSLADFTGDARIDAIFNGHYHQDYLGLITRDGLNTFVMQSGANGNRVGYATFSFVDGVYAGFTANNLRSNDNQLLNSPNDEVQALIDSYAEEVSDLMDTNIITSGEYLNTSALTQYISKVMRLKTDSDIAFHNYGGTRTSVDEGTPMTVAVAYQIFPFDNVVKTTELLGSTIKTLMSDYSLGYDTDINTFNDNTYYKVATNDYVYDGNPNTFNSGLNPENTGLLLRDLFIEVLEDLRDEGHTEFYLNLDIPELLTMYHQMYIQFENRLYVYIKTI